MHLKKHLEPKWPLFSLGKGLVLGGWPSKIEVIWVPGIFWPYRKFLSFPNAKNSMVFFPKKKNRRVAGQDLCFGNGVGDFQATLGGASHGSVGMVGRFKRLLFLGWVKGLTRRFDMFWLYIISWVPTPSQVAIIKSTRICVSIFLFKEWGIPT